MAELVAASLLFLSIHAMSSTPLRGGLVRVLGETMFRALFSLASLLAVIELAHAYNNAPVLDPLWVFGAWARWLALVMVGAGVILVVCGLSIPNPSAAGFENALLSPEPGRGILRVTRHPFLWGVGVWALAHLLTNGDPASAIFFATFALLALCGTMLLDRKKRARHGAAWRAFEDFTSNLPFAAIVAGRNHFSAAEIGWWRILLSIALFLGILWGHALLFGVTPLP